MLKIRWSRDRLIFNMRIPILVRRHLYIETAPWVVCKSIISQSLNVLSDSPGDHLNIQCHLTGIGIPILLLSYLYNGNTIPEKTVFVLKQAPIQYKDHACTSIGNLIMEIWRSYSCLASTVGFLALVKWHLYITSWPWFWMSLFPVYWHNICRGWCHAQNYPILIDSSW